MARVVGIKPTLTELEAAVLSLHYTRKWHCLLVLPQRLTVHSRALSLLS